MESAVAIMVALLALAHLGVLPGSNYEPGREGEHGEIENAACIKHETPCINEYAITVTNGDAASSTHGSRSLHPLFIRRERFVDSETGGRSAMPVPAVRLNRLVHAWRAIAASCREDAGR
jgi:hypothetical protein